MRALLERRADDRDGEADTDVASTMPTMLSAVEANITHPIYATPLRTWRLYGCSGIQNPRSDSEMHTFW